MPPHLTSGSSVNTGGAAVELMHCEPVVASLKWLKDSTKRVPRGVLSIAQESARQSAATASNTRVHWRHLFPLQLFFALLNCRRHLVMRASAEVCGCAARALSASTEASVTILPAWPGG